MSYWLRLPDMTWTSSLAEANKSIELFQLAAAVGQQAERITGGARG
ncbi:hypothetical protein [Hymenobacter sp. BT730]|nr:hypothetical protein [Hymenobacter sp. BT730]